MATSAGLRRIGAQTGGSLEEMLGRSRGEFNAQPSLQDLLGLLQQFQGLEQERGRLGQQVSGITSATPEVQQLAHQAAYAPLQGLRTQLDSALLQAANAASSRGLGRGSISAALQAQAVPQVMEPALARAQGLESQLLLDIPFRERQFQGQFGLQSLGLGGDMLSQRFQGTQGIRDRAFSNLAQALQGGESFLERNKKQSGLGRALGGILGAGLGYFTGGLGTALGGGLGRQLLGGGSDDGSQYAQGPSGGPFGYRGFGNT